MKTRTTPNLLQCRNRRLILLVMFLGASLLLAALSGCAGPRRVYTTVDDYNARGEFTLARNYVKDQREAYGGLNKLLYYLDTGMFAFSLGEYSEAIAAFTEAELIMNELYTISLGQEATTFLINDNTAPYRGEEIPVTPLGRP